MMLKLHTVCTLVWEKLRNVQFSPPTESWGFEKRAFFVGFGAWHVLSMQLVSLKHTGLFVPRHIFSCSHVYPRSSSLFDPIIQNRSLIVNLMFFISVNNIKCYCISAVSRRTACFILPLYFTSHGITIIVIFYVPSSAIIYAVENDVDSACVTLQIN